jgi:hypothetical protein
MSKRGRLHPLWKSWRTMIWRCGNPKVPKYAQVKVDERWMTWEGFLANQPAGRPWEEGLHLCRFGDVGDYSPENTRWDTAQANARERNARRCPQPSPQTSQDHV